MKRNYKGKLFKSLISISVISALLLLLSVPFVGKFNYSSFNALAVNITPSQDYKIQFDLPHIKPITASQREKADKNLSKVFGIKLPNLKDNEAFLSKPNVEIKLLPITGKYVGSIKIDNLYIPFSKITKQFTANNKNNELPSKILLTAYFTLNSKPLRANIFIINNGSVLKYASMTVQDKDDNVLAMFTYGKVLNKESNNRCIEPSSTPKTLDAGSVYSWETEKVLEHQVKYITINDPFGNLPPSSEPSIRLDAMSNYPFNNSGGAANYLSSRIWGFNTQLENSYKNFYESAGWGNVYSYAYINNIDSVIETRFPAEINESNLYPKQSGYSSVPISISFSLFGVGSVSYSINVPYGGVKKTWTLKNTIGANPNIEPYNYGKFSAFPFSTFTWRDSNLFWNYSISDALSNDNPSSDYGGFYCRYQTSLYASGDYLYALYSGDIDYGVKIISTNYHRVDYYYISTSESFPYVNLAQ